MSTEQSVLVLMVGFLCFVSTQNFSQSFSDLHRRLHPRGVLVSEMYPLG